MRSALLPDNLAAVELGHSWRHLETLGVLGLWAVLGLVLAPVVLRRMARRESGSSVAARREKAMQRVIWECVSMSETVYNRIAMLRAERGISRRQLADALGVHYQTVGYLERGEFRPSLYLALRLAEYFEVPVEVIFSVEPFPRLGTAATA